MTDFYPSDGRPQHLAGMDFIESIDELIAIVEGAKSVPLSSSVLVSRDEIIDLLLHARDSMPAEFARAKQLLVDRNEMWAHAEREANALINEARAQAAHLVQRTEVVRQANAHADRIVSEAQAAAVAIRREAEDFIDKKLAATEIVIDRVSRTLAAGREKLKLNLTPPPEPVITPSIEADLPASSGGGLFDQDLF